MIRRPRHRAYHANAEINIANLVDVVLVLLIIFMISAPLLQSGIEINLPKTRAAVTEEEAQGVVLTIDSKGGIYINDKWTTMPDFEKNLNDELKRKNTHEVYLRGDSAVAYGVAIDVIGQMKEMGIEAIGLVTTHQEKKRAQNQRR
ncbi:MAG: biopolymer transporter ExbD [candidate division Zixibacteria bacterium]|nr:biopolymer transporter ExbD [candidate division Zixibacteria bacterium]